MLPREFNKQGVLSPGDYPMTIKELRQSIFVSGPGPASPNWDAKWRLKLVENFEILARQLWSIGITEIYIDGSFVENRDRPNDIDGYFVCTVQDQVKRTIERKLNAIDPFRVWGWEEHHRHPGRQLPMRRHYNVELWPYAPGTMFGTDNRGNPLELHHAFRRTKIGNIAKGVIKLVDSGEMA